MSKRFVFKQSVRRPPPMFPRLNNKKEIEFSMKPSDTKSFFYRYDKEHIIPTGLPTGPISQEAEAEIQENIADTSSKTIFDRIEDARRILFLILTEPRSGIVSCIQYTVLIGLILLANLIMIMQTNRRFQFTPVDCDSCNMSNDNFDTDSELMVNETDVVETAIMEIPCECKPTPFPVLVKLEALCIFYFTVEWTLRVLCFVPTPAQLSEQKHRYRGYFQLWCSYLLRTSTIIDALSIFSFYIIDHTDKVQGLKALRMLRVLRLFQIIRIGQYSTIFSSLASVASKALTSLNMLIFVLMFGAVFFGSMIFYFEKGEWKYTTYTDPPSYQFMRLGVDQLTYEPSPFTSITASFWWFIVTATTVGYGDFYPTSIGGKLVAVCAMLVGLLVIAFPVSVFSDLWSKELKSRGLLKNDDEEEKQPDRIDPIFQSVNATNDDELRNLISKNNSDNIIFDKSDLETLCHHWSLINTSQNEIRNIIIRNLQKSNDIKQVDKDHTDKEKDVASL